MTVKNFYQVQDRGSRIFVSIISSTPYISKRNQADEYRNKLGAVADNKIMMTIIMIVIIIQVRYPVLTPPQRTNGEGGYG
jgi:hypothetical protein